MTAALLTLALILIGTALALALVRRPADRQDHDAIIKFGDEAPMAFREVQELPPELLSEHTFPTFTEN